MRAAAMNRAPSPGSWIPWLFVGFFLVVVAANATMIWFATESWTGLATNNAYDKGLRYNRNLEAAERQARLGWQPRLTARVVQGFQAEAELVLVDAQGAPVRDAEVLATLERPTQDGSDFKVPLAQEEAGVYRAAFDLPLIGLWDIHLTIRQGDDTYVHEQRVMLR
jgi:nitrogen fixation protein FixH